MFLETIGNGSILLRKNAWNVCQISSDTDLHSFKLWNVQVNRHS